MKLGSGVLFSKLCLVWWVCAAVASGCGGTSAPGTTSHLVAFGFTAAANPTLASDVTAALSGTTVAVTVPAGTDVSHLVATFTTDGDRVEIAGVPQVSGVTANDFTSAVTYEVIAGDGSTTAYSVTVEDASQAAKALTAFGFLVALNSSLTTDVTATISGTAISATLPHGALVSHLVATFTTTGASVAVLGAPQTSGLTAIDFQSPVPYTVTAADGTTQVYTVTVTVAPDDAKDLTAFAFLAADNASLTADVTATIGGTSATVLVPAGTDVTALVATFTSTGSAVQVGSVPQVSGTSVNDFASPVTYTVTAADGTTRSYIVSVLLAGDTATCGETYLEASNPASGAEFGYATALSGDGNTLVVGAFNEASNATGVDGDQTNTSAPSAGAAYVFVRSGATWVQQAYLKASNTNANDQFGFTVAISDDGNTVAIAAPQEAGNGTSQTNNAMPGAGAVYVFARSGSTWTQQAYLKAGDVQAGGGFGLAVALSRDGTTLAGGSPLAGSIAGTVTVFGRSGATWTKQALIFGPDGSSNYGTAVALSATGDTLVAGAYLQPAVSTRTGATWGAPVATLPTDCESVAISAAGDEVLCGRFLNGTPALVFTGAGSAWTQAAELQASNADAGDFYGVGVALSADGSVAVVGAMNEASAATCTGGDQSDNSAPNAGAIYKFVHTTAWAQTAYIKSAISGAGQRLGASTSLSDDGSVLAAGLPGTAGGTAIVVE